MFKGLFWSSFVALGVLAYTRNDKGWSAEMDQPAANQALPSYKVAARDFLPEDNFETWRQTLGSLFDIDLNGIGKTETFRADIATYFMGPILLGTGDSTAQNYERTNRTIARSGVDPLLVQLYTRGGFSGTADGREMTVKQNDIGVLDMARCLKTHSPRSANITLVVPRALLAPLVKDVDALHGTVLDGRSPHGGIIGDYLRSLHARIDGLTLADANALAGSTVALMAACLGPSAENREAAKPAVDSALMFDIRRFIDANLASYDLTPEKLARRFAISRASLYRLFEPLGGVAKYVRKRRLYHSLLDITSPAKSGRHIGEIAYGLGFASESGFSRAFRAAYGVTPQEARETPASVWSGIGVKANDCADEPAFVHWLRDISR
jgi:AraC-like DNA-binding protein